MKCALMNSFLYKIHNGIFILKGVQYVFSGKKIALGTDKNKLAWDFPLLEIKVSHKIINSSVSSWC